MSESDSPEPLRLDEDVAKYLHYVADSFYGGDMNEALNETVRALLDAESRKPVDVWAAASHQNLSRFAARQRQAGSGEGMTK